MEPSTTYHERPRALGELGDPYEWASEGPDGFDCSGLTRYAWSAHGIAARLGGTGLNIATRILGLLLAALAAQCALHAFAPVRPASCRRWNGLNSWMPALARPSYGPSFQARQQAALTT